MRYESIEHYDSVNESYTRSGERISFPDAQGYGSLTAGGRGGELYLVDRLDDDASVRGTLRHAVEKASRPLTVLFRVAGNIRLKKALKIKRGQLTLDGGDAPDRGVCVSGPDGVRIQGEEIIVRRMRFRLGPGDRSKDETSDALTIRGPSRNVVVDQCSVTWGTDETLTVNAAGSKTDPSKVDHVRNITVQRCIIAEAFGHGDGSHRFGGIFTGADCDCISVLRCLFVHCDSRNPRAGHYMDSSNKDIGACTLDFGSNVVYNWGKRPGYNGEEHNLSNLMNFVGNWYATGPSTDAKARDHIFLEVGSHHARGYFCDNALNGQIPRDPYSLVEFDKSWSDGDEHAYRHTHEFPTVNTVRVPIAQMPDAVLDNVGCMLPERDAVDRRIVDDVYGHGGELVDPDNWDSKRYALPSLVRTRRAAFCYAVDHKSLRNDIAGMQQILHAQGYGDTDIRVWPKATLSDYKSAMKWLTDDDNLTEGDRLFFYSGSHGTQTGSDSDDSEADSDDEAIVTADHKKLLDDKVRRKLIKKVPKGVMLNAVLMSCHSGTMADMEHNYRFVVDKKTGKPTLQHRDDDYKDVDGTVCVLTACDDAKSTWSHYYGGVKYTALGGAFVVCAPTLLRTGGTYADLLRAVWQKHVDESIDATPQLACQPKRRIDDMFVL